ncbi:neural cell adhesion molecule L1-like [Rhinoraja longicauda]
MTGDKRALLPLLLLPLLLLLTFCQQCNSIRIPPQYKLQKKLPRPPIITEQTLEDYTVFPTDDIVLKCEATGEPMPIFRWTKDGTFFRSDAGSPRDAQYVSGTMLIATSNNGISFRGLPGDPTAVTSATMVAPPSPPRSTSKPRAPRSGRRKAFSSSGRKRENLWCYSANPPTSMASSMIIWMTSTAPYWVRKPQDGVYWPGENVLLDCDVDAKPKAHIRWSVNGVPLNETDSDGRRTVTGSRVVLTAVKPEDTAVYQCLAENRHGKLLANIIVQVIVLPTQILTPSDLEYQFVEKQTAYIHCKAFGEPTPKIAWSKEDMTTVLQGDRYFQYTNGTLRIVDVQGGRCRGLHLQRLERYASQIVEAPRDQHVQRLHAATFSCVVEVDPSLPPPSLQWSKDGQTVDEADDDDSKYHIREGLLKVKSVGYEDEGMYKCEASSLLDSVTASAQLIVVDYPDPPFDLQVDGFTAREALLSWTPGNDHNSPIERFLVEFEEDLFEPGIWQLLQMVEGDHHEAQLDLSPYVNYSFRVVAVNRLGRSEPSPATQHYMTPPAAPEKNPEGVKGEGSHPSNMIITWQVLKGLDWNGPGLQYEVKWRRQDVEDEWKELVVESPPYLVNATPTFVPYQIQVQAINEEGSAPEPHTVIGYSGEDYPLHSPKSVTVENVSSSSVRVKWTRVPIESLRGLLRGYNISYWEHQSTGRHHQVFHGDHNHALIKELKPYTTYDLEVRVFNSKGESPLNDTPYQFITPEGGTSFNSEAVPSGPIGSPDVATPTA